MLAKNFSDKAVFGWYDLREYNRSGSDNSFEVVLWTNSTFDYRYGELDINRHDVLIGEQKDASNYYQYLFYDECSTGTTNTGACVNVDWNNSIMNSTLESGGSLYGTGEGNTIDCSNPLNDMSCPGYWNQCVQKSRILNLCLQRILFAKKKYIQTHYQTYMNYQLN